MAPTYKLIYFNLRGRAELHRYIFAVAGQEYEDFRFERSEWPEHKPKMPFAQAPVLEVSENGKTVQIAQSGAIARFLARKYNLYGKNEAEMTEIDMYADQITDLAYELGKVFGESDEAKKKEKLDKLKTDVLPNHLKILEEKLIKNATGFLVGDSVSWVDFHLIVYFDVFHKLIEDLLPKYPHILAHDKKVKSLPKVADWIAKRPVTVM